MTQSTGVCKAECQNCLCWPAFLEMVLGLQAFWGEVKSFPWTVLQSVVRTLTRMSLSGRMYHKPESPLTGNLNIQEGSYHWENAPTFLGLILCEHSWLQSFPWCLMESLPLFLYSPDCYNVLFRLHLLLRWKQSGSGCFLGWVDSHLPSSFGAVSD